MKELITPILLKNRPGELHWGIYLGKTKEEAIEKLKELLPPDTLTNFCFAPRQVAPGLHKKEPKKLPQIPTNNMNTFQAVWEYLKKQKEAIG